MGKGSRRKMKWRSLDINTEPMPQAVDNTSEVISNTEVHPFLKIISKNMDAIVKKDTPQNIAQEESKLVYLYRSDRRVEGNNNTDINQFTGDPLQYNNLTQTVHEVNTVAYNPYTTEYTQNHEVYPVPLSSTMPNCSIQSPQYHNVTSPIYQHPMHPIQLNQPVYHGPHPHQPSYHPQVQYVPYYYFYPVPVQPVNAGTETHDSYKTSSESVGDAPRRQRRKKRKTVKEVKDVDSGYYNDMETSTDNSSEKDTDISSVDEREITNLLIEQIQNPTVDFEFGEVQEILDTLCTGKPIGSLQSNFEPKVDVGVTELTLNPVEDTSNDENVEHLVSKDQIVTEESAVEVELIEHKSNHVEEEDATINKDTKLKYASYSESLSQPSPIKDTPQEALSEVIKETTKYDLNEDLREKCLEKKICKVEVHPKREAHVNESQSWKTVSSHRKKKRNQTDIQHPAFTNLKNKPDRPKKNRQQHAYDNDKIKSQACTKEKNVMKEDVNKNIVENPSVDEPVTADKNLNYKIQETAMNKKQTKSKAKRKELKKERVSEIVNDGVEISEKDLDQIEQVDEPVPLEDVKTLFYKDKDVEIIELPKPNNEKKHKDSKVKQKQSSNTKSRHRSTKNKDKDVEKAENLMAEFIDMNFPVLFFHPFQNFEDQLSRNGLKEKGNFENSLIYPPHPMTFFSPSYRHLLVNDFSHHITPGKTGPKDQKEDTNNENLDTIEEELVNLKALKDDQTHVGNRNCKNTVLMIKPTIQWDARQKPLRKSPLKNTEVPGPRLKYSPVVRCGPLGVQRQVVPPRVLANRFNRS